MAFAKTCIDAAKHAVKRHKTGLLIGAAALFAVFAAVTAGYAYFTKRDIYSGYFGFKIDLMFDQLTPGALADYQTGELGVQPDADAEWGTEKNPYIISNINHLYNLSALQNIGFFHTQYISKNYGAGGAYINGSAIMPYFRVCTNEGRPVTIDGADFNKDIEPIGAGDYSFIGSVKGAFADGICSAAGKNVDVSAIHHVTVTGNPANADIGLFGSIGYLGTAAAEGQKFSGVISVVSDLVLTDIRVKVKSSLWDNVTSFIHDHVFSFTGLSEEDKRHVAHENHHIGIFAGHISYSRAERISVYYSADDIKAVDLTDSSEVDSVKANYMSVSGIIGFMDNMNPLVDSNGDITAGSGDNISDISFGMTGGGGGLLSGTRRGYVLASEIYDIYKYDGSGVPDTTGSMNFFNARDIEGKRLCTEWVRKRILWGTQNTGRYYFYDGVFTFALSDTSDTLETIWPDVEEGGVPVSTVPTFTLGSENTGDWDYGTLGKSYTYYANLTEMTSANFLEGEKYALGWKDTDGNLYLADLSTTAAAVNGKALSSFGGVVTPGTNGSYEVSWGTSASRGTFMNKLNKITKTSNQYTFTNLASQYKLGVRASYIIWIGTYSIYCGSAANSGSTLSGTFYAYNADLTYNSYFWLMSYTASNVQTRHITAAKSGNDAAFDISTTTYAAAYNNDVSRGTNTANAYRMYIYKVTTGMRTANENDPDAKKGWRPLTDPVVTQRVGQETRGLTADKYVLWPNTILNKENNDDLTVTSSPDPVYTLKSIESLGWRNRYGDFLAQDGANSVTSVNTMFNMKKEIQWGMSINLFGGTWSLNDNAMITAPIGSDGAQANIPMGCVAFKVNKASDSKIRVIVAVPFSDLKAGETGCLSQTEDYYLGLWHSEPAGQSWRQGFDKSDAIQKFELPRSQPKADTTAGKSEYISVEIDSDGDSVKESYRAYLQGDIVLAAYEFSIGETGVYILGATNGPMQIVYFAADGVASGGRDGIGGSNIGTIDFVYDYGGSIIPVSDNYITDDEGNEDYGTYYPSFCIVYFDNGVSGGGVNGFADINNGYFQARRYIDDGAAADIKSALNVDFYSSDAAAITGKYMKADTYSHLCDVLTVTYTESS